MGNGFDWYGNLLVSVLFIVYGLLEFKDMLFVYDVDLCLICRIEDWLFLKCDVDGFWELGGCF